MNFLRKASTLTDYTVLAEHKENDEYFLVVLLSPSHWSLNQMDRLYQIGFGSDHAAPKYEHICMTEDGIVIGILSRDHNLVGMRAIVRNWRDSIPVDTPLFTDHLTMPYLNHTVINPRYRNSLVGTLLTEHTALWLQDNNHEGLRNSVAPWNLKNVGYFTKNGGFISDFVRDLYGPDEHRFHGIYKPTAENTAYLDKDVFANKIANGTLPIITDENQDGPHLALELKDNQTASLNDPKFLSLLEAYLNRKKYDGVCLVRLTSNQQSFLILQYNPDKVIQHFKDTPDTYTERFHFRGLRRNTYLKSHRGLYHTLTYAVRNPKAAYEFTYEEDQIAETNPMLQHPLQGNIDWVSLNNFERTRLVRLPHQELTNLYALDATDCVTRSIKDHASEFVATFMGQQPHLKGTALATTGNMGASEAAALKAVGKIAHVFVPARTPQKKLDKIKKFGGHIHLVQGSYDDAVRATKHFVQENPEFLYSGETALRLAGNEVTCKMIVDKLGRYPERVIVPVGDGAHFLGLLMGFKNLQAANYKGGCEKMPLITGIQVNECNPISRAFERKHHHIRIQRPNTIAEAIAVGEPLYGDFILKLLYEEPNICQVSSVPESEIPESQKQASAACNTEIEESSSVVWAGLNRLIANEQISQHETTVLLLTGHQSNTK